MRELILSIAKSGKTIIISSHILDEIQKMCTHYIILKKGKLLKKGAIEEVIGSKNQFQLSSENANLFSVIETHPLYKFNEIKNGKAIISFSERISGTEINQFLIEKGVVLSELIENKTSLEEEFLQIVK
jgi:ABC-2 type transport system ATP-binding protein